MVNARKFDISFDLKLFLNILFEIKSATDDYMIPVTEDFIESIDKKKKCIYMCLPDGLLSIN